MGRDVLGRIACAPLQRAAYLDLKITFEQRMYKCLRYAVLHNVIIDLSLIISIETECIENLRQR